MTNVERNKIIRAIRLIHDEDDYHGGMSILAKLVGLPADDLHLFDRRKPVSLQELAARPNSEFAITPASDAEGGGEGR